MPMVTRWCIQDEAGLTLTRDETWSYDGDDAIEFRHEDEAWEAAALYRGATAERFERYSAFPDITAIIEAERSAA